MLASWLKTLRPTFKIRGGNSARESARLKTVKSRVQIAPASILLTCQPIRFALGVLMQMDDEVVVLITGK